MKFPLHIPDNKIDGDFYHLSHLIIFNTVIFCPYRHKFPRSPELNPAPVIKPHVSVSETGVLPHGSYNSDNFTIHGKDSTPNPNMAITGLERLTTGSTSTVSTQTTQSAMNIKAECGGYINVHASQRVPDTSDYYYCDGTTTEMKLLHQSSVPAVDLGKEYYYKHFEELSVKVKHLENLLAATLVQKVKTKTSQAIQTDPMQDSSRMQLLSQYEEAIKEVQILTHLYNTLQKQESKLGSTPAKKAKVQSMSEVDKMAIQVDRVVRQLDACCTERDLYKSEVCFCLGNMMEYVRYCCCLYMCKGPFTPVLME